MLHALGYRFRLHPDLPGTPDIVLPKYRTVIFVHGCFWHGHKCKRAKRPASNTEFWNEKLEKNIQRDKRVKKELRALGWRPLVIWQCRIKELNLERLIGRLP